MDTDAIKFMAQVHRDMDSGKIKHVILNGERMPVINDAMEKFELVNGQTIDRIIFFEIVKYTGACVAAQIAIEKIKTGGLDENLKNSSS